MASDQIRPSWPTTVAAKDQAVAMVGTLLRMSSEVEGEGPRFAVVSGESQLGRERIQAVG